MGASAYPEQELPRPGPHMAIVGLCRGSVKGFPELALQDVPQCRHGMLHARATTLSMAYSAGSDSMRIVMMIFKGI